MTRKRYFHKERTTARRDGSGYQPLQKETRTVQRAERDTPSGAHAIEWDFNVDSTEVALAIEKLLGNIERNGKATSPNKAMAHASWQGGYIAAMVMLGAIVPEQADALQEITDRTLKQALKNMVKRGIEV